MCKFIMLVGLPGSGKSTYAKKLEEEGYRIHSSDAIRKELLVMRTLKQRMRRYLRY